MRDIILTISGYKGVGKTTFANRVKEELEKVEGYNPVVIGLADAVKKEVAEVFGISLDELEELKRDESKKVYEDMSMRDYLISYAEHKKQKAGADFWVKKAWNNFLTQKQQDKENILVISDLRFPEEQGFLDSQTDADFIFNIFLEIENYRVNKDFGEKFYQQLNIDYWIIVQKQDELQEKAKEVAQMVVDSVTGGQDEQQ